MPTSIPIPPWLGWCLIGLVAAGMLALIGRYLLTQRRQQRSLVDRIDRILPQTQCGQCGYEGCRPYARAISAGAAINKCPPGGHVTIVQLADLLNELPTPLDPAHGQPEHAKVARIREAECIGCKKCIRACPVDAILGATKQMHTVIESECTGCDLCVEPCPVDCIDMVSIAEQPAGRCELPGRVNNPLDELEAAYR